MAELGEKCAVFGVYGKGLDVARLTYFGLYALQHRGQESSGIAVSDGTQVRCHKAMGLVSSVYTEDDIKKLTGHIAMGHNRYSTAGGSKLEHAQPVIVECGEDTITLAHNGNLPSTAALEGFLQEKGIDGTSFSDSRMIAEAVGALVKEGKSVDAAVKEVYPLMTGAFSLLIMSRDKLIALRDRCGVRPLSMARLNGGWVFASETCALAPLGATLAREVEPGEMVVVDSRGMRGMCLAEPDPKFDVFEFVYFARPDSVLLGQSVYEVRRRSGMELAKESPLEVDVVIPVPETGIPAAIGYSGSLGLPFEMGLAKNRYIHRTFIQPEQHMRQQGVKAKLTPIPEVLAGKRVAVLDDSIVRGTTSREIVAMLYEAGAKEVHFLVSSPPVLYPDFYGIDTPAQANLIAATKSVPDIRDFLGATTLNYLSYEGLVRAVGVPEERLCTSCFTGRYPIDIKERAREVREISAPVVRLGKKLAPKVGAQ
ncbi:MAG TPA: amidophosphoribosyltransferase [Candidatus Paceibacterota bacterium]|nr:amidophosphoribosyltransferase [Candidatus Paceibacterota bacterium]